LTFTDWIIGHTPFEISAPLSDGHASLLIKLTKPKAPSPPFGEKGIRAETDHNPCHPDTPSSSIFVQGSGCGYLRASYRIAAGTGRKTLSDTAVLPEDAVCHTLGRWNPVDEAPDHSEDRS
jgi:hypothetical protein